MAGITKQTVKAIVREEIKEQFSTLEKKIDKQNEIILKQGAGIDKIVRLLLGEEGIQEEDTLAYRARFAHTFAQKNEPFMNEILKMKKWYAKWDTPNPGCRQSNFEKLGEMIRLYGNLKWLVGTLVVLTGLNTYQILRPLFTWILEQIS